MGDNSETSRAQWLYSSMKDAFHQVKGNLVSGIHHGDSSHPTLEITQNQTRKEPWATGYSDCSHHPKNAIMTAILPCVTFGQIVEILDDGQMSCCLGCFIYSLMMPALCSQWIMGSRYRTKLRNKYNLVEAPYKDRISHIFCPCCSLCQEFRELKHRGLDPSLGWKGNPAQQQRGQDQFYTPPHNQTMWR